MIFFSSDMELLLSMCIFKRVNLNKQSCSLRPGGNREQQPEPLMRRDEYLKLAWTNRHSARSHTRTIYHISAILADCRTYSPIRTQQVLHSVLSFMICPKATICTCTPSMFNSQAQHMKCKTLGAKE